LGERVAGIDIGKAMIMVTIRVPGQSGKRQQETREFRTVRKDLLALADWLRCWQVAKAGMEATGDYWKPVYFLLEREGLDCVLYHASQVKALPGRPKTDKPDSVWLARITERGSLPGSFVPPEDIRRLRTHTRYRRHLIQARTAEMTRCEKLPEDAHIKLSSVISDLHGKAGRNMLDAIIAGERNPKVLAQMALTSMRRKIAQLEEALDCSFFTDQHAFILAMMLASIDHLTTQIGELDARLAELCQPYEQQIAQLDAIPGFGIITAQDIIAETGTDMTVFPTAGHLCSWARQAPQVSQSAGKRRGKNATGRGNPCIGAALGESAIGAGRTQTFPGTKYRRLVRHMPRKKAQGAIMRTQLVICHALLSDPEAVCEDLGTGYYEHRANIRRDVRNHARAIERRGYKVILEPLTPDAEPIDLPTTKAS
jgi:transposase